MSSAAKVSVVVPTFKRTEFLDRCLNSVALQTLPNFEVVVVNDDPNTAADVRQIMSKLDARFRLIENSQNLGVAVSRNKAIAQSGAPIIAPLDDDDWWEPNFLECHVAAHERDSQAVVAYSGYFTDASQLGLRSHRVEASSPPSDLFEAMLSGRFSLASSSITTMRRQAVIEAGGYDAYAGVEDWDLLVRLSRLGRFVSIRTPLTHYVQHLGFRQSATQLANMQGVIKKWSDFPQVNSFVARRTAATYFNASRAAVFAGDRRAALSNYLAFLRWARKGSRPGRALALLTLLNTLGPNVYRFVQNRFS